MSYELEWLNCNRCMFLILGCQSSALWASFLIHLWITVIYKVDSLLFQRRVGASLMIGAALTSMSDADGFADPASRRVLHL